MPAPASPPPSQPPQAAPSADDDRFARHRHVPGWDQEALANATVIIMGVGALGNVVAQILATSGVGRLILCDPDTVSASNLSRTPLFRPQHVGQAKVDAAAETLTALAPDTTIDGRCAGLVNGVGLAELRDADLVIGCLDSRGARLELAGRCGLVGARWIDAATTPWGGEVRPYLDPDGPCYSCTLTPAERNAHSENAVAWSCTAPAWVPGTAKKGSAAESNAAPPPSVPGTAENAGKRLAPGTHAETGETTTGAHPATGEAATGTHMDAGAYAAAGAHAATSSLVASWTAMLAVRTLMGLPPWTPTTSASDKPGTVAGMPGGDMPASVGTLVIDGERGRTWTITTERDPGCPCHDRLPTAASFPVGLGRGLSHTATVGQVRAALPPGARVLLWQAVVIGAYCGRCRTATHAPINASTATDAAIDAPALTPLASPNAAEPPPCPSCGGPTRARLSWSLDRIPATARLCELGVAPRDILAVALGDNEEDDQEDDDDSDDHIRTMELAASPPANARAKNAP